MKNKNIKIILLMFVAILITNCATVMDGLLDSAHREVDKIGAKEVHILNYNSKDKLYYITNDFGTYKFTGKNYIKYNNGKVKEKSQFKDGQKHGKWIWYNKYGKKLKKEVWEKGVLISSESN
jgi:antitoxin component YwqK of YwqJK toxin-antitoxin module